MDEQKLTDWFPPEVLPARPGWYQRKYSERAAGTWMDKDPDYFDGKHWYYGGGEGWYDPRPAAGPSGLPWRGLAEPPLTDWFDPDTPPEREGVYEIEGDDDARRFANWRPKHGWGFTYKAWSADSKKAVAQAIEMARFARGENGEFAPVRRWRGLAVQP